VHALDKVDSKEVSQVAAHLREFLKKERAFESNSAREAKLARGERFLLFNFCYRTIFLFNIRQKKLFEVLSE
jgi:hypothetical protein